MAKRSFKCFVEQELGKLPHFLIYAVLEWVLIAVLFIDGFLAFFANEFAQFFELKIPCLLCTRIDHVVVRRSEYSDFYYNESICETHKKEVSGLAFCHVHKKLSDIRKMCEGCLLSFAAAEKELSDCDTDTYKRYHVGGVLHKDDIELFVDDDCDMINYSKLTLPTGGKLDKVVKSSLLHQYCLCCGDPLKVKSYTKGKINAGMLSSQAPPPSPRAPFVMSLRNDQGPRKLDLSHVRYTELRFSENDSSELHDDDDEDVSSAARDKQFRDDVKAAAMVPLLTEAENVMNEDRTPTISRGNRFFGIPLTDSAAASPRAFTRFPRKSLVDKTHEHASESTEGTTSLLNEVDSNSILNHLKKQVRLDRKSLLALYMELDEERSASAVAANNAMAMITRLQAEKAAVQMEALQYQRMMDEQAEYDQEALQATRDIVSKREEQIKALEVELMAYREKYGVLMGSGDYEIDEDYHHDLKPPYSSYNTERYEYCLSPTYSSTEEQNNAENVCRHRSRSPSFQDDDDDDNGGETEEKRLKAFKGKKPPHLGRLKNILEKNALFSSSDDSSHSSSDHDVNHLEKATEQEREADLVKEFSHLHGSAKALEAQGGFLKLAGHTLQNGSEVISDSLQKISHLVTAVDHA